MIWILWHITNIIDRFVDHNSNGVSSAPATFDRIVTTRLYNISYNNAHFKLKKWRGF